MAITGAEGFDQVRRGSMSKSPGEVVRAFVAAINAGDPSTLRELMTEDHTFTDARETFFPALKRCEPDGSTSFTPIPAIR
jgi:hypothetical protein